VWDLNLGVQACQNISNRFDIGGVYMLHRGTCALSSNHDYTHRLLRFYGSYAFRCRIGLKIILKLARATREGNT
jgi:hypothetical protein